MLFSPKWGYFGSGGGGYPLFWVPKVPKMVKKGGGPKEAGRHGVLFGPKKGDGPGWASFFTKGGTRVFRQKRTKKQENRGYAVTPCMEGGGTLWGGVKNRKIGGTP